MNEKYFFFEYKTNFIWIYGDFGSKASIIKRKKNVINDVIKIKNLIDINETMIMLKNKVVQTALIKQLIET